MCQDNDAKRKIDSMRAVLDILIVLNTRHVLLHTQNSILLRRCYSIFDIFVNFATFFWCFKRDKNHFDEFYVGYAYMEKNNV